MMTYGYARVSGYKQLKEGFSLEDQVSVLMNRGCNIVEEEQYTGTTTDRPKFNSIIERMKPGDTIMCTTLDRFARNTEEGLVLINKLIREKKYIHILDLGLIEEGSLTHKVLIPLLLSIAEMEREKIITRCKIGKERARTKEGYVDGRPKTHKDFTIDAALTQLTINGGTLSYKKLSETSGISISTLKRAQAKRNAVGNIYGY